MRVLLDTNVLIDGITDDFSPQAKLIDAIREGKLIAIATRAVEREYRKLTYRLIHDADYQKRLNDFFSKLEFVERERDETVIDDEEDRKFLAAARGGKADLLVTKDRHLLDIGEINSTRIVTPPEAWIAFSDQEDDSNEWQSFATGIGIGKRE